MATSALSQARLPSQEAAPAYPADNEYVAQLSSTHHFVRGKCDQNVPLIRSTVPGAYQADFDRGLAV